MKRITFIRPTTVAITVALAAMSLIFTACADENLGGANLSVPQIDVCVPSAVSGEDICYEAEKVTRVDELCSEEDVCRTPILDVDLGVIDAGGSGSATIRVKNVGDGTLNLYSPSTAPGSSTRYRLEPAQDPTEANYAVLKKNEDFKFQIILRGTMCGEHKATLLLSSNDAAIPEDAPRGYVPETVDSPVKVRVRGFVSGPCLCPVTSGSVNFGRVPVGRLGHERFTFASCGDEALVVSETYIGKDSPGHDGTFNVEGTVYPDDNTLEPGEVGHVDLTFLPSHLSPPPDMGELWIKTNAPTAQPYFPVPLGGEGAEPPCKLIAFPSEASFGVLESGESLERTFRLFNAGDYTCHLHTVEQVEGSAEFSLTGGVPATDTEDVILSGESHTLKITYAPTDDVFDEALFRATARDDDNIDSSADITLSGNPVIPEDAGCVLNVQPDFGDFGDVTVGAQSDVKFDLSNVGTGGSFLDNRCTIDRVELFTGTPHYRLGDLGMLANTFGIIQGMTSSIQVYFEPQDGGMKEGVLRFHTNDAISGHVDIPLWGNAIAARLCVSTDNTLPATEECGPTAPCDTLDFGPATETTTQNITLTNCSDGDLRIRGLSMDPAGGVAFIKRSPAPNTLPIDLGPGQSTAVQIEYRPSGGTGDFGGLDVISNASNAPLARIDLRGNYSGDCTRILRCAPSAIDFGTQDVGIQAIQTAICTNFGTDSFLVTDIALAGSPDIALESSTTAALQPGDSMAVQLSCTPSFAGMLNANVSIYSGACDASPMIIPIACFGFEPQTTECIGPSDYGHKEKWRWTGSPDYPGYDDVWVTPVVINLTDDNDDGRIDREDNPDVIFTALASAMSGLSGDDNCNINDAEAAIVVAVEGKTGEELWAWGTMPVGDPADPNARAFDTKTHLATADIDADGMPEIIGVTYTYIPPPEDCDQSDLDCCMKGKFAYGSLTALEHDGTFKWESARWHLPDMVIENDGAPAIGDMNGDGIPEISFGNAVFDNNGLLLFEGDTHSADVEGHGEGNMMSAFLDIDGDGMNELVAGRTAFDADGSIIWDNTSIPDGLVTVANVDADDHAEIILFANGDDLYVLEAESGAVKYGPVRVSNGATGEDADEGFLTTNPAVGDLDGDGFPEIVIAAQNVLWVYEHDLTIKWSVAISDQTGASGPTTFDFEGDGKAEVVYADEGAVYIFDGLTGASKYEAPRSSRTITDNPVIVDVDNNGHADILLCMESTSSLLGMYGLIAYSNIKENWVGTRRVWNQHTYHITNISESGVVPAFEGKGWLDHNIYRSNVVYCEE